MLKHSYPTCHKTFQKWLKTNKDFKYMYEFIGSPRPHDITLNTGLYKMVKEEKLD